MVLTTKRPVLAAPGSLRVQDRQIKGVIELILAIVRLELLIILGL